MEFNEKLQQLRKQKGLTQEELAAVLHVSRAAVSKWESGRGWPGIDSLKNIAGFFSVTVDELLSPNEALTIGRKEAAKKDSRLFSLLDCSAALLFFLPFFGQPAQGGIAEVSLLSLTGAALYLRIAYLAAVALIAAWGVLTLALPGLWPKHRRIVSLLLNGAGVLLFIGGRQPYAAALLFVFLLIKMLMLVKKP